MIENDDPYNEIIPGLFIGNVYAAEDPTFFRKHNIKAVVNCAAKEVKCSFEKKGNPLGRQVDYFKLYVSDTLKPKDFKTMINYLPDAVQFIKDHKKLKHNILINCVAGKNRSAAVGAAYLSSEHNMTINEAINYIIKKRKCAFNDGESVNFESSLIHFTK